ncbi:hypothetical protein EV207_11517 [Scopulibacillus darangshiensis]|uniref:Uncharacterized protein n=1 Tax=Scopulibacillus darangshiensis TaxID=442528 RepID=A0A4R2P2E3_9BACL|nr:hypothetical protein [Scopulibacillus darangshiensis]TCP28792.1 hypothetical protein EV207_11517 [Scopulibacillus darangshiensis]
MGLREIFGAKKKTELEKNQEELNIVNSSISEEQATKGRLAEATRLINIELEIGTDKELERRAKRIQTASEQNAQRLADLQARKAELERQIQELNSEKRLAHLHELAEEDLKSYERGRRATVIKQEIRKIFSEIESRDGQWSYSKPERLLKEFGIEYGHFNQKDPVQKEGHEIWEPKRIQTNERIDKEAKKLIQDIKDYMGE